jgi:hypothetical protein
MMTQTYYDVLGVPRRAKLTDITRAYNRLNREVTRDDAPPDLKRQTALREAYETLSDPDRRERYDASLLSPDRRRRSRTRGVFIGAVGATVAGSYLIFAKPPEKAPVPVRTSQELLQEVSQSIGRVHRIEISGSSLPVGMAFAIADGILVTSCAGLTPDSQIVVKVPPRSIPARVAFVDAELGLCRLTAQGVGARPLDLATSGKRGDLVYAPKVDAAGQLQLAQSTLKNVGFDAKRSVKRYESGAWGIAGAPLLDVQGNVVGVATDDQGGHIPVPPQWLAEARDPLRDQKPVFEVLAPATGSHPGTAGVPRTIDDIPPERREKFEKAYGPRTSVEDELAKMK